jgi:NADPH:quinone reductase-like Zn-dependent oxidoreductase
MGTLSDFHAIISLIKRNAIKPIIDRQFSYREIKTAHQYFEKGSQFGKVVITF